VGSKLRVRLFGMPSGGRVYKGAINIETVNKTFGVQQAMNDNPDEKNYCTHGNVSHVDAHFVQFSCGGLLVSLDRRLVSMPTSTLPPTPPLFAAHTLNATSNLTMVLTRQDE